MKMKTGDGLELFYHLTGTGIPCVYLHGGPGYWSKSFQHFANGFLENSLQMVYLDQRGCGRSEHSASQDYSLKRLIDDIEELRKFLGIEEWFVMGHSFGGILAVNYAQRFPHRTKGLILSNATLNMFNSFQHQMRAGSAILGLDDGDICTEDLTSFINTYYSILIKLLEKDEYFKFQYKNLDNKQNVDLIDQEGLNSDPGFQRYVFSSKEYFQDFTTLTENILKPVLVIAGKDDHAVGPNHQQLFRFPNAELKILNSGHHPYIENQSEFKAAVLDFVHQVGLRKEIQKS